MAAGLADRRQRLEETAIFSSAKRIYKKPIEKKYWFEIPWYNGVTIANQVGK
jgi:hypothetical protein